MTLRSAAAVYALAVFSFAAFTQSDRGATAGTFTDSTGATPLMLIAGSTSRMLTCSQSIAAEGAMGYNCIPEMETFLI
jgi:hypothetical protein